ncbi:MAG: SBBP repeat-containing protein [Ignavibacteria bacterium]|nr:SBBP repeat-containing protein [Ignavibacteria bacterium]
MRWKSGDLHYDDYVTVKYDSAGIEQWNRRYNGSANFIDQARALVIDKSNNVYISGYATQAGTGYDFTTIKYDPFGNQIWLRKYNNGLNDVCEDMTIDKTGYIYLTGYSDGSGTDRDYATLKYDSSGNQLWAVRYDYSGVYPDYPSSLAVDILGSVFVTGQSNRDFLTVKHSN